MVKNWFKIVENVYALGFICALRIWNSNALIATGIIRIRVARKTFIGILKKSQKLSLKKNAVKNNADRFIISKTRSVVRYFGIFSFIWCTLKNLSPERPIQSEKIMHRKESAATAMA